MNARAEDQSLDIREGLAQQAEELRRALEEVRQEQEEAESDARARALWKEVRQRLAAQSWVLMLGLGLAVWHGVQFDLWLDAQAHAAWVGLLEINTAAWEGVFNFVRGLLQTS